MDAWTITQVAQEMADSFAMCHTNLERQCWRVGAARDVRRILNGRKPTPAEHAILDRFQIAI